MNQAPLALYAVGYGRWPVVGRIEGVMGAIAAAKIGTVVDARLSPCAPSLSGNYGPKPWNLQPSGDGRAQGLAAHLEAAGVGYEWIPELGNPQKNDPEMSVFREHLRDASGRWPVARGLARLRDLVTGGPKPVCLLCTCRLLERCHVGLLIEALATRLDGRPLSTAALRPIEPPRPSTSHAARAHG
jgi:hypothetical protein